MSDGNFYASGSENSGAMDGLEQGEKVDHVGEMQTNGNEHMLDSRTPASKTSNSATFFKDSSDDVTNFRTPHVYNNEEDSSFAAKASSKPSGSNTNSGAITAEECGNDPLPESEFSAITREAGELLNQKLENNREWAKKLLRALTIYVGTLEEVQKEYLRIQQLEQQESERLDQVEPDVQGLTRHLLEHPFEGHSQGTQNIPTGDKRKHDHL